MTPETANRIMHRFESGYPMSEDRGTPIDENMGRPRTNADIAAMPLEEGMRGSSAPRFKVSDLAEQIVEGTWTPPQGLHLPLKVEPERLRVPRLYISMSDARAKIAAMNHDAVSAALWALSGFDPALAQLAELREHFLHTLKLDEEDQLRITLDRLVSVYVEGQCRELLNGAEITTDQANLLVELHIGDPSETALHILGCTSDPLAMELNGYALWLGSLTAYGTAPWKRFAATMADCYYKKHPLAS